MKQRELLPAVLDALARSSVGEVVVVEGAHELDTGTWFAAGDPGSRVSLVRCESWERGPGASLRCGLGALGPAVTRAAVVLADGPELDPRAVDRVLAAGAPLAAATYDGTRSHPVALDRTLWKTVPDEGARALEPVLVDCSDLTPPGDVDTRR